VKNVACTTIGVCGKSPTISALQDLIVHYLKGLSMYGILPEVVELIDDKIIYLFLDAFFMILTNVNFNKE
jgi:hydroxylamine reductase